MTGSNAIVPELKAETAEEVWSWVDTIETRCKGITLNQEAGVIYQLIKAVGILSAEISSIKDNA